MQPYKTKMVNAHLRQLGAKNFPGNEDRKLPQNDLCSKTVNDTV